MSGLASDGKFEISGSNVDIYYSTGISLGVGANFKPYSSKELCSGVNTLLDIFATVQGFELIGL